MQGERLNVFHSTFLLLSQTGMICDPIVRVLEEESKQTWEIKSNTKHMHIIT